MKKKNNNLVSVLRVEHRVNRNDSKCYRGPYFHQVDRDVWDKNRRHSMSEDTPPPHRDKGLSKIYYKNWSYHSEYFYGFKDLEQLSNWFNKKEIKILKKMNFVIREYIINKKYVTVGDKQTVFIPTKKVKSRIKDLL